MAITEGGIVLVVIWAMWMNLRISNQNERNSYLKAQIHQLDQRIAPTPDATSNIQAIGQLLYSRYLYVFEGAGLVLLVAMIGAIVLTRRARGGVKGQENSREVARRPEEATRNMQPPVGQGVEL